MRHNACSRIICGGGYPSRTISISRVNDRSRRHGVTYDSGAYPPLSRYVTVIIIMALLTNIIGISIPIMAYADTTTTATTDTYQLYDTRERNEQVSVNKVWDDGLTNDERTLDENDTDGSYENYLSMTIKTGVPQTTLRTYTITYDANGGSFGTGTNGNAITTNTITYNAKNQPTVGTYTTPERTDGYSFVGWSTYKTATSPNTSITVPQPL